MCNAVKHQLTAVSKEKPWDLLYAIIKNKTKGNNQCPYFPIIAYKVFFVLFQLGR